MSRLSGPPFSSIINNATAPVSWIQQGPSLESFPQTGPQERDSWVRGQERFNNSGCDLSYCLTKGFSFLCFPAQKL